jgi:penicillin-binding protein 1A
MRRKRDIRETIWLVLRVVNLSLLLFAAGSAGLVLGTYSAIATVVPRARDLGDLGPALGSRVFSAEGELLATVATENRQFVPLERIPKALQEAAVATEDRDFYEHIGISPRAIVRAALHDVIALGPRQGGSTITQQLARNVYLSRKKTLTRKLAEVILALQFERAYTKPEIMELYLNQIYFGEGSYGVQVASKTYFGKDVWELSLAECALLAGLPKRPEYYSPFKDEERARVRRNLVLTMMTEEGYLGAEEAGKAKEAPLKLVKDRKPLGLSTYRAPYFTNYVLRGLAAQYGPDALYRGGLKIYTTLNQEMQGAAEEAVAYGIERGRTRGIDQIALVAVDVRTGAVKAMVGGADWGKSQYNRAVQGGRQAGSSFKPFVYTAALEQGYTPESIVDDVLVSYPGAGGKPWTPKNYDGKYHGKVTFRSALANSYNAAAVRVAATLGIDSVIATAERMGIYHEMGRYLPLAIGYCDVSPLEMASAFAVFAARGMRTEPYAVVKIVDAQGRTIEEHKPVTWRALDQSVADQMVSMLTDVVKYGTGRGIRGMLRFPAAGKTGTSNEYRDSWFIGFTDDLCCAVWAGNDAFAATKKVAGATIPAPVWARFMQKAEPIMVAARGEDESPRPIEIRSSLEGSEQAEGEAATGGEEGSGPGEELDLSGIVTKWICPKSGLLAGPLCPNPVEVTYDVGAGGEPPEKTCEIHGSGAVETGDRPEEPRATARPRPRGPRGGKVSLSICAITGKLATSYCPIVVERDFDSDKAPTETCTRHGRRPPGL